MIIQTPPKARTPLHDWHRSHGARCLDSDGWQLPEVYTKVDEEIAAARLGVALTDVSAFAKISISGKGIATIFPVVMGDKALSSPGNVAGHHIQGGALACRLTRDQLLLLAATTDPSPLRALLAALPAQADLLHWDTTTNYAGMSVVGPQAPSLVRRLTALDCGPAALPAGWCAETGFGGIQALLVRPPHAPLPMLNIYVAWDLCEYVWDKLLEVGNDTGIAAIGIAAWRKLTSGQMSR